VLISLRVPTVLVIVVFKRVPERFLVKSMARKETRVTCVAVRFLDEATWASIHMLSTHL
jgi:hypothetical protein